MPLHEVSPHILTVSCTCSRFVLRCSSMCVCVSQYPDWIFHMRAGRWPLTFDLCGVRVSVESLRFSRPLQVNIISNTFQDPAPAAAQRSRVCARVTQQAVITTQSLFGSDRSLRHQSQRRWWKFRHNIFSFRPLLLFSSDTEKSEGGIMREIQAG